jgi:ribosome-binding protein aMBF1 (putative translation factor)
VTPQKCLETRLRLGWSRAELAAAAALAAPIVRLYEAGALDGFDDCAAALEAALADGAPTRVQRSRAAESWFSGLAEAGVVWRGPEWTPFAAAG